MRLSAHLCNQASEMSLCVVHKIVWCSFFSSSILYKIWEETSSFWVDEVDLYLDWLLIGGLGCPPNVHDMNVNILSFGFGWFFKPSGFIFDLCSSPYMLKRTRIDLLVLHWWNFVFMQQLVIYETSASELDIIRDISRTFPSHVFFQQRHGPGQRSLYNVLKAYSVFDRDVGYVQVWLLNVPLLLCLLCVWYWMIRV